MRVVFLPNGEVHADLVPVGGYRSPGGAVYKCSNWYKNKIIGFGRVTTDCSYRAVIWDVVVEKKYQGSGIGKLVIAEILKMKKLSQIKKIYVMTTNQKDFYLQMGFKLEENQYLMIKE